MDVERVLGDRYRLTSLLHRGQGVDTFLAQDVAGETAVPEPHPGHAVVVKVAHAGTFSDAARRRLDHESLVLSRMRHPNLVRLLDRGRDGDLVYAVTPWVPGRSLAARLIDGPLSVSDTVTVARDLVAALCHAHDHGVLHRDVKPANVIVAGEPIEHAVLIDFGLARSELLDVDVRDVPVGTVRYLAPEQAGLVPDDVDERSDLYAAGLTIIECLTGVPVFGGPRVGDVLRQQMTAAPPLLEPPVPRILGHMVDRLVRRDPAQRYQSAAALLADLDLLAEALDTGVAEPSFVVGSQDRRETLAEPSFVGREFELSTLESHVAAAAAGDGGIVLVGAGSGTGKSRLLAELSRRTGDHLLRLHGQGLDQAAQRPFQALSGVVRDVLRAVDDDPALGDHLRSELGQQADAVAVAFPELAKVLGVDGAVALGPEEFGEVRTVRALAVLLDALGTAERPALVVVDDCQWADELSGRLLARWNEQREAPCHVLVVAAFRNDELGLESAIRRVDALDRITLPPLQDGDVEALAGSMAGVLPEAAVEIVSRLAEGSPFMAAAVLRGLVESGALVSGPDGWEVEPDALAHARSSRRAGTVLAHRITLLNEETQRLLAVGAVLGKQFEIAVAAALAGVEPVDVGRAVREASRRHLVWTSSDGGACSFVHDKIRETLLDLLDHDERRELHERTAILLEEREPTRFFDLAFHFDAAGQPERALPYALTAADQARAQSSLEVVEQQYRIAERGAADTSETRRRIAEELGRVLMLRGRYGEAADQLERARMLADDAVSHARIDGMLGELAFKRGDMTASSVALERALRTLGQRMPRRGWLAFTLWEVLIQAVHTLLPGLTGRRSFDHPRCAQHLLSAHLYSRLAHTYWFQRGSVATAFAHLRGMNIAERYPPSPQRAQAYSEHAPVMSLLPWYSRGIDYAQRGLAIRRDLDDLWGQGRSLHFYGVVLYAASHWAECMERCREAIRLLDRTGDRWELNTARWHIAYSSYRLGDLQTAAEIGQQVWRDGSELGDPQARGIGLAVWSKATGGQIPADAIAPEIAQLSDDVHTAAEVLTAEAIRLLADDRPDEAVACLARADRLVRDAGLRQEYVAPVPAWLLTAMRARRDQLPAHVGLRSRRRELRRARRVGRRALRLARRYRNNLPHVLRELALIEAGLGHGRRARRGLDRSIAVAEELGARHELATSQLARGELGTHLGWDGADDDLAAGAAAREPVGPVSSATDRSAATVSLVDRYDSLLSAGRRIASTLNAETALTTLADAAESLLRPQDCLVFATPDLDRNPAVEDLVALVGTGGEPPSRTLIGEALQGDQPVVVHEPDDASSSDSMVLSGMRSVLCAPVCVRGEAVACLYVSHRDVGGAFGDDEVRIAAFLTALAGAALENAEGFAQIEALTRTLEQRVADRTAELTDTNAELDRRLAELGDAYAREQEIIEQLRRLDQFKTELMAITAHDLRTPLAIIVGFATTLHDHAAELDDDQRATLLDRIVTNTRRLSEFVENLLQFGRIESGELVVDALPLDLGALIRRTVAEFETNEPDRSFELEISDDLPTASGDESRQWQILMNLLSNAVKYSPDDRPITVSAHPSGDEIEVSVTDRGAGIPDAELPKLFGKFQRVDSGESGSTKPMGTGLGLYICRSLVEAHGGQIRVSSAPETGTTFTYTVPTARSAVGAGD